MIRDQRGVATKRPGGLVLAIAVLAVGAGAASGDTERLWLSLRFGPTETTPATNLLAEPSVGFDPELHYVIQLDGPMTAARRQSLESIGVSLGDYIPDYSYVVTLPAGAAADLISLPFVSWLGEIDAAWKIAPEVSARLSADPPEGGDSPDPLHLMISLFQSADAEDLLAALADRGAAELVARRIGDRWLVTAVVPVEGIESLAELKSVQLIELAPATQVRNDSTAWIVQSNIDGQTPLWDAGILGQNQIAGLIDTGVDLDHCSFSDTSPVGPWHRKFVAMRGGAIPDRHGTAVAGTLAGDAGIRGEPDGYDGLAPMARISFSDFAMIEADPLAIYEHLVEAYADGARAHNNSWGDDTSQAYTSLCRLVDQFSYTHEDSLVLFAITNLEELRTPENAKNVLAVGASRDAPWQHEHAQGGHGPTSDGRRKPEIFAPGFATISADYRFFDACAFGPSTGTSMACAVVTGGALLVRQYVMDGFYPAADPSSQPFEPTGAMVKALLLNGAVDMTGVPSEGNEYPSFEEGWGRMLLDNTLEFEGDAGRLWLYDRRNGNGLDTGEEWQSPPITVGSGAVPFRVTLVFTEPPGSAFTSDPVVNNLDLEVLGPDGVFLGNVFVDGQSALGGVADRKNNVEQVQLITPQPGEYVVTARGTAVNEGLQGFAVVVSGDIDTQFVLDDWPDCNGNGIRDTLDIEAGTSQDCQSNGMPDECEALSDCDESGIPDECESLADCNSNGVPDPCEEELDCNSNGVPDDCESIPDCNFNGLPDTCDILYQIDCQQDGIPDVCQIPSDTRVYDGPAGVPIPDGSPFGVSRTVEVDEHFAVWDVDLALSITHGWNGDLVVRLEHGDVTAVLVHRPGYPHPFPDYGFGDPGFEDVILDDWSRASIETETTDGTGPVSGTFRPHPDALAAFAGVDAFGAWTLTVIDSETSYSGTLDSWTLFVSEAIGPPEGCTYYGDCTWDGYVDLEDYAYFAGCMTGPDGGVPPGCECLDIEGDGDVDLMDYGRFGATVASGTENPRTETTIFSSARP